MRKTKDTTLPLFPEPGQQLEIAANPTPGTVDPDWKPNPWDGFKGARSKRFKDITREEVKWMKAHPVCTFPYRSK